MKVNVVALVVALIANVSLAADAPEEMKGRWKTDDGQYSNTHEVKILKQSGDQIFGTLQTWSGRCKGAIAQFTGTFDGTVLTITTGPDSPCSPVTMQLTKEPNGSRYSGSWQIPDFKGTAYLE